jgi:endonuclease G
MAKFRRNHTQRRGGFQVAWRFIVLVGVIVVGLLWVAPRWSSLFVSSERQSEDAEFLYSLRTYLPSSAGEVVHHSNFTLSYSEPHEQAAWTAYVVKKENVRQKNYPRSRYYFEDPKVSTGSAQFYDYKGSGYERGHLVPAADMRFDSVAIKETFYMSNMSPMLRPFNNGIWRELEIRVRNWSYKTDSLYVISGPVLNSVLGRIGQSTQISVPSAFFKIILDYRADKPRVIAFIIPHALSEKPLQDYAVSVQEVEKLTGLTFFSEMLTEGEKEHLFFSVDTSQWKWDRKYYDLRVRKWNYE